MKQKSHSPELISRPLVTRASQENDAAKIRKIIESVQEKLKILSESYRQVYNPKGFITDLKIAMGMDPKNASGYALFDIGESQMRVSIRVSNHHANARKYLEHEPNDFNLSVMVSKRYRKNTFQADSGVVLKEFVYMGRQLETVESPFSQIATSLTQFLETGEYVDTTGVAKVNISPAPATLPPMPGGGPPHRKPTMLRITETELSPLTGLWWEPFRPRTSPLGLKGSVARKCLASGFAHR